MRDDEVGTTMGEMERIRSIRISLSANIKYIKKVPIVN